MAATTLNEEPASSQRRETVPAIRLEDKRERNPASERRALIRFLAYLKPYLPLSTLATFCGIANYAIGALIPSVTGYLIDRFLLKAAAHRGEHTNPLYPKFDLLLHALAPQAPPDKQADILVLAAMGMIVLSGFIIFVRIVLINVGGQRVTFHLRNHLFEHIQGLSLTFFQTNRSGSIVSRLTSDIALAQNFIGNACAVLWMDSISVVLIAVWLFVIYPRMALVSFIVLPLWIASVRFFGSRIREASHEVQEGLSDLTGQVQEKVAGATVVQAFAREKREARLFHRTHRSLLDRQIKSVHFMAYNTMASTILTGIAPLGVILFGMHEVMGGRMSPGMLITFWTTLTLFYFPLQRLTDLAAVIANATAAIERIFEVFDIQSDIQDSPTAVVLPRSIAGSVEFRRVEFGYENAAPVLKGVDLKVESGEVVAFVGPSGAGKTTLVNLVPRFYDVHDGGVFVDGHDVRDIKLKSLRNNVGMVLQDNILFTGSIRDNILYGRPNATEEEMVAAAVAGNAHDFILAQPDGYDSEIGERGTRLSGGQKQRLAISRAFLRDPRILILDEATSALDSESERLIQAALNRLMIGRTTLIIAHRLSTIMHADKIVAMQEGRIVEVGSHAELLAKEGLYYHLYKAQFEHASPSGRTEIASV